MSETCDHFDCEKATAPDQSPRPEAQLCAEHEAEIKGYIERGEVRKIVAFGVRCLPDPLARQACAMNRTRPTPEDPGGDEG